MTKRNLAGPNDDDWIFEQDVEVVVAPCCGFMFAACHRDLDGGYSCPACGEMKAEAERDRYRGALAELGQRAARLAHAEGYGGPTASFASEVVETTRRTLEDDDA